MTLSSLRARSLAYHWRTNLAVILGVIAAAAALTGALLVGDSLRGSLCETALDRLQRVDGALRTDRLFRESLAADIRNDPAFAAQRATASAALLMRGSAVHADSKARANHVEILGVDGEFWRLRSRDEPPPPNFDANAVALNASLAAQLGAKVGDDTLLRFERLSAISSETLMGRRDDRSMTIRARVVAILPDDGIGGLALAPRQQRPLNAFIPIGALQRALEVTDRANAILFAGVAEIPNSDGRLFDPSHLVKRALRLEDYGLTMRLDTSRQYASLESASGLLPTAAETMARAASADLHAPHGGVLSYLANEIRATGSSTPGTPYSTVAAVEADSPLAVSLASAAALGETGLRDGEVLLNQWTADDLQAKAGDRIEFDCYITGEFGRIESRTAAFTLRGIVPLDGAAADPGLVPEYKGVTDTKHMSDWDPPFPVDLKKVRPKDEEYWEQHKTTPKAFITLNTGRQLWTRHEERFGRLTSLRINPAPGESLATLGAVLEKKLLEFIAPDQLGIHFDPVRDQALAASEGATDFGGLFIGFSFFLIASASMLIALLFRLGVERRAVEIGTLLAMGFSPRQIFRGLAAEGAILALIGCAMGLVAAAGYAWLMLAGLRTQWSAAVNAPFLRFHFTLASLAIGFAASFLIALASVAVACRGLSRMPPRGLMAGNTRGESSSSNRRRGASGWIAIAAMFGAAALLGCGLFNAIAAPPAFFGGASLLLIAALSAFRWRLSREPRDVIHQPGMLGQWKLACRSARRAPNRSLLIVSLLASATFLIVAIGAFRVDPADDVDDRNSGTGGFSLYAEATVPLVYDLNSPLGRDQLGLSTSAGNAAEPANLDGVRFIPFRLRAGDAASCLNLYQRVAPRILGAPPALIERGGFRFVGSPSPDVGSPWALLEKPLPDGVIPAIGDEAAVKWQLHSGLGQDYEIVDERGRTIRLRFVALLTGSVLQDELIVSEASFTRLFPSISGYSFFLIDTAGATNTNVASSSNPKSKIQNPKSTPVGSISEVERSLERGLADFGFDAAPTRDRLRDYLAVQNTYLSTFQSLGGVGLLLGSLGMTAILLRSVWERRRELALLRAVGFPARTTALLVWLENAMLCVVGLGCGTIPALLAIAPLAAQRPIDVPWFWLALTLASVVLVASLAGAVALRPMLRSPLLPALRGE